MSQKELFCFIRRNFWSTVLISRNFSITGIYTKNGGSKQKSSIVSEYGHQDAEADAWIMVIQHFAPVWLLCTPCEAGLRPDVIVKLETIGRDGPALMQMMNLSASSSAMPLHHVHVTTEFERPEDLGVNSRLKAAEYYGQLTKRQVAELYEMYRLDHDLFGYSPEPYIAMAMD